MNVHKGPIGSIFSDSMGTASGAGFRGVEGSEERGVAVNGSGGGLSVGGGVMCVLLAVRFEVRI